MLIERCLLDDEGRAARHLWNRRIGPSRMMAVACK